MEAANDNDPENIDIIDALAEYSRSPQVKSTQIKMLLEFLEEHPTLAQGLRGGQSKGYCKKHWSFIADKLNTVKSGAQKDFKGWAKFWCDWKYRVRRKYFELQASRENKTTEIIQPLTGFEETVLKIIGQNSVNGLVIKKDPLSDEDGDGLSNEETIIQKKEENVSTGQRKSTRAVKRRRRSDSDELETPLASLGRKPASARNRGKEYKDESHEFLRIEKEKLEHSRAMREQIETIASEMTRLSDAVCQIRDYLISNRNTLH